MITAALALALSAPSGALSDWRFAGEFGSQRIAFVDAATLVRTNDHVRFRAVIAPLLDDEIRKGNYDLVELDVDATCDADAVRAQSESYWLAGERSSPPADEAVDEDDLFGLRAAVCDGHLGARAFTTPAAAIAGWRDAAEAPSQKFWVSSRVTDETTFTGVLAFGQETSTFTACAKGSIDCRKMDERCHAIVPEGAIGATMATVRGRVRRSTGLEGIGHVGLFHCVVEISEVLATKPLADGPRLPENQTNTAAAAAADSLREATRAVRGLLLVKDGERMPVEKIDSPQWGDSPCLIIFNPVEYGGYAAAIDWRDVFSLIRSGDDIHVERRVGRIDPIRFEDPQLAEQARLNALSLIGPKIRTVRQVGNLVEVVPVAGDTRSFHFPDGAVAARAIVVFRAVQTGNIVDAVRRGGRVFLVKLEVTEVSTADVEVTERVFAHFQELKRACSSAPIAAGN